MFIDTLYEAHGNLIASAEAPPAELYDAGDGAFEFERTVSRLIEMQSDDYIRAAGVSRSRRRQRREAAGAVLPRCGGASSTSQARYSSIAALTPLARS